MRPIVLVYAPDRLLAEIRLACEGLDVLSAGLHHPGIADAERWLAAGTPLILVGVGVDCVALARSIGRFSGLVRAVILIAPEAPLVERYISAACPPSGRAPTQPLLGPLEPLRAWVARAREGASSAPVNSIGTCTRCGYRGPGPGHRCHADCRLIITAHPEPVGCEECGGAGDGNMCAVCERKRLFSCEHRGSCPTCSGTGHALGPVAVARELLGAELAPRPRHERHRAGLLRLGGVTLIQYAARADHDREAIGASLLHMALDALTAREGA